MKYKDRQEERYVDRENRMERKRKENEEMEREIWRNKKEKTVSEVGQEREAFRVSCLSH